MVQGVRIEKSHIVDVNPATGDEIARVKVSTTAEVDACITAAKRIQPTWAALGLPERTELVRLACQRIGDIDGLATLITKEMGKTLRESEEEVADNADKDEYCQLVMQANEPEAHGGSVIVRHPHGVVSICAPWNYPVEEIVLLSIPALIAGNAVVIKPSEVVPLAGAEVAGAFIAGLNDRFAGLVGLVQGDGAVGSYLVAHPDVDMCAFTGSTATGEKILEVARHERYPAPAHTALALPALAFGLSLPHPPPLSPAAPADLAFPFCSNRAPAAHSSAWCWSAEARTPWWSWETLTWPRSSVISHQPSAISNQSWLQPGWQRHSPLLSAAYCTLTTHNSQAAKDAVDFSLANCGQVPLRYS